MYAEYNLLTYDNINYTVDMLRLKTAITYTDFSKLEFKIKTLYNNMIKKEYVSGSISEFKYNYNIKIGEGQSYWFGFIHNSEIINKGKSISNEDTTFNFTVEFNPNKIPIKGLLRQILKLSSSWTIKSLDIAMDLKINIMDLCGLDKERKKDFRMFTQGLDNRTYYMGRTNNRIKIYNKKIESNLDYDLTRVELTSKIDLDINNISTYVYNIKLPDLYLNSYLYTFSDYKDKTLLALLYAIQSGFNINDLTPYYKRKIKNMLQGDYKINLSNECCTNIIKQCIYNIFNIKKEV